MLINDSANHSVLLAIQFEYSQPLLRGNHKTLGAGELGDVHHLHGFLQAQIFIGLDDHQLLRVWRQ